MLQSLLKSPLSLSLSTSSRSAMAAVQPSSRILQSNRPLGLPLGKHMARYLSVKAMPISLGPNHNYGRRSKLHHSQWPQQKHRQQRLLSPSLSHLYQNKQQQCLQFRSYTIPVVLESGAMGERSFDIYSRLLRERIICVHGEVTDHMASVVTAQLLFLEAEAPDRPLYMYINSPGGSVTAGMAMYDTMQYIRPEIHTIAMGQAASMGSLLLAGGAKGCRHTLPNATIMLHQPSGGAQGMASDIQIRAEEILRLRASLNNLYLFHVLEGRNHSLEQHAELEHSGETLSTISSSSSSSSSEPSLIITDPPLVLKEIEAVMDRDTFMTADQAMRFGIVDEILIKREVDQEDLEE